jgi:uncharacterized protein
MHDPVAPNSPPPLANRVVPPPMPLVGYGSAPHPGEEEKTLGMTCHLLAIFTGFLGPLVLWLVKKDGSAFVDHHGREALNFQITVFLVMLGLGAAAFVLMLVFVGFLLIPLIMILPILAIVAEVLAAVAAQRGDWHRYPFCIRLF